MKKLISTIASAVLMLSLVNTSLLADPAKGQKFYLKYMKEASGINGAVFAKQHTQAEWAELFDGDASKFTSEYLEKYPNLKEFFESERFQKAVEHIKDFCIEYAADSGKVPNC